MSKEIVLNNSLYGIEPNCYNGDIVLIGNKKTLVIDGGYELLQQEAQAKVGRYERGFDSGGYDSDELEYSEQDERYYIQEHIEGYISRCFQEGKFRIEKP